MNIQQSIILCAVILVAGSCKKLDTDIVTQTTKKQITEQYDNLSSLVMGIYADLPEGFQYLDGAMTAAATDEAEFTLETSAVQKFNVGGWNAYNNPDDVWSRYYSAIRRANFFLENSDSVKLDFFKLDPDPAQQSVYQTRLSDIKRWQLEVRFLRSFYYFELVKRYGGVPLISHTLTLDESTKSLKRNTLAESLDFITSECGVVTDSLVELGSTAELGRVTKACAMALKSRALLYAASDLFNTPGWAEGFGNPELISLTGDRNERWKTAADAAKAVIDLNLMGGETFNTGYRYLFTTYQDNEIIMARRDGATNSFEMSSFPIGFTAGKSGTTPAQNLVDAYERTDGTAFDWSDPAQAADPYIDRDPRLAQSVVTNNSSFGTSTISNGARQYNNGNGPRDVQLWAGGLDGKGIALASKTGYYIRKYTDESLNLLTGTTSVHSWILFRLAEMYLNYAEALNEYQPGDPDIKKYIDLIRARIDVNMPPLPGGLSQNEMRDRIRNERRIELAFEGHRFWDARRWMLGPEILGADLQAVEITLLSSTPAPVFRYRRFDLEPRVFTPRMYLYPLPQSEIVVGSGALVQNPMW